MQKIQKLQEKYKQTYNSQSEKQKNICRICLQQGEQLKKLPCACKGSLSYMHDRCLSQMLQTKNQDKKDDVPDYVQLFKQSITGQTFKAKCQICLHEILLEKQSRLSFERLVEVEIQVYLILVGMIFISMFGLNIAYNLLLKALEETGFVIKIFYFSAYVWIIGVIAYVILEPLYTQIKVINFKIKQVTVNKKRKETKKKNKNIFEIKQFVKKLIPSFVKKNHQDYNIFGRRNRKNIKSQCTKQRERARSISKLQSKKTDFVQNKVKYFQI